MSPTYGNQNPIEVEKEELRIDCRFVRSELVCAFDARYYLVNPTDVQQVVVGAFYGEDYKDVAVYFAGEKQTRRLTRKEFEAVDSAVVNASHVGEQPDSLESLLFWYRHIKRRGGEDGSQPYVENFYTEKLGQMPAFEASFSPWERNMLLVTGKMVPAFDRPWGVSEMVSNAAYTRHLAFGDDSPKEPFQFVYLISPIKTWAKVHRIEIIVSYPESLSGEFLRFWEIDRVAENRMQKPYSQDGWTDHSSGGQNVAVWRYEGTMKDEIPNGVVFRFYRPWRLNGGMFVGIGGRYHRNNRFISQVGVEFAHPHWLFYGLSLESDFREWLNVTPQLKAASPMYLLAPSVGFAIGMPVQIQFHSNVHVGIRFQLDCVLGPIGIAFPFDIYPGLKSDDDDFLQFSMMGMVSF
ncbi:MAG: hypothetical protein JXX29_13085 [Deltaproteobacteria bacterium]|nr:hypothetical protein [Deltaproteobacteria bacterium]MBN2672612.1 hypothetical protein [Deltaproteobacteria bacterium]